MLKGLGNRGDSLRQPTMISFISNKDLNSDKRLEDKDMKKKLIQGSFVALITPFNQNGTIDFGGFQTIIDFQAAEWN